jgi:DNA-binding NarL/FixJ family response regulator
VIRVLIVDDNAIFRQGMKYLFESVPDLEVSAVAGDGASRVDAALAQQVDVVLMDLAMPGISGIDATRKLAAAAPHIGIVVMTMLEDDDMVVQALRAGARGYLVKGAAQREILDTVRGVHAGQAVIGADVARRLGSLVGSPTPEDPFPDLTARAKRSTCSPAVQPRSRSPIGSASRVRPCGTTCRASSRSSRPSTAPRRCSRPAPPGFHDDRGDRI